MKKLILCLLCAYGFAFDSKPWLDPIFETQFRLSYTYQFYNHIKTSKGSMRLKTKDNYFDASLAMTVWPDIEIGLFLSAVKTSRKALFLDSFQALVKYQLLDDCVGDFVSFTLFGKLIAPYKRAIKNFGRFYHSFFEGVVGFSVGKEFSKGARFTNRLWFSLGLGIPNRGSAYSIGQFEWEYNIKDLFHLFVLSNANFGLGDQKLIFLTGFDGYRHLRYRAIDIGGGIKVFFGTYGNLTVSYLRRVYTHFAPQTNQLVFVYHLPFSLF